MPESVEGFLWMEAYADAVIFKSSIGTGKVDFVQGLQTLSGGGVYFPEEIRKLGEAQRRTRTCRC